ncbi:MAG: sporulation protein YqfD [Clostridia bacterium]|nr:sporulation protein YqfD [Clostridia bacterium]
MNVSNFSTYVKAVVEVEAEGFFVERLINLCKINNIKIWNITYINEGRIRFLISPKEFKKLKPYVKKSKCKIKIIKKKGIYFDMFRYRKRKLAIYLVLALLIVSFIMSNFIWHINITGNEKIEIATIETLLKDIGMHEGKFKFLVSKGKVADYIRANLYEVAWVGVDIDGTTMNITITEKIISEEEDKTVPGNIIATKSAVISKIIAENGTAKFKTGSYITEGSVAIEGIIASELMEPSYVHASGILRGIVEYTFEKGYKYVEQIKEYTGKSRHGTGVKINNKEFLLKYLPKENKYDINSKTKMFEIFSVDISFIFNTYDEYILKDIVRTKEELASAGQKDSTLYFEEILTNDSKVVEEKVDQIETKDGIIYKVVLSVEENIGEFIKTGEN